MFIPKSAVKEDSIYVTKLGKMKSAERLETETDCRLTWDNGRWYLCAGIKSSAPAGKNHARLVALDPGVRSFITFYSERSCGKIGLQAFNRILSLGRRLDNLIARMSKACARKRRRMKAAARRARWKIRDLIDELHHQAAAWLCERFDIIIVPKFETSRMTRRCGRKLRSRTVRAMMTLSHYRFQQFLVHKAKERGKRVVFQDEAYTSKIESWTGKMQKIGGRKYIAAGDVVVDRDYNAARNIMLRALSDTTSNLHMIGAVVGFCQQ
jgi:putative transposase